MTRLKLTRRLPKPRLKERRAMAVAQEQEMQAEVIRMKAKVVEAQSEVPLALIKALESGKMGYMDFYKMDSKKKQTLK